MPRKPSPEPPRRTPTAPTEEQLRARLRQHIKVLGLIGLTDEQLAWAVREGASYTLLIERVLGYVAALKTERCIERRIKDSGLKEERKTLEEFDWSFQPKLDRPALEQLAALDFVKRGDDLIFTGKPGTGKSHLLKAIALRACAAGKRVRYARCVDLLDELYGGLADGSYEQRLRRCCRVQLLVIDDVGLGQLKKRDDEPTAAHILYNLIDRRHQRHSTAFTSNIKLSAWGKYLGDATLTAAILDRLAMTSIRIDIDGPSYRQHLARQRAKERSAKS